MENNSDSVLEMYLYETNTLLEQLDNIMLSAEQADTLSEHAYPKGFCGNDGI